jgi:16S rRNA (guanine(1405)-N(7))-methyltransferase
MKINNVDVNDELITNVVNSVRSKKTLIFMDEKFIISEIVKFLSNHLNYIPKLNNKKSKEFETVVKHVRSRCHDIYEIFQTRDIEKRDEILNSVKKITKENVVPILETHISTKERLPYYENLYKDIFNKTGIPKIILDIGCGLNPISIPYMDVDFSKIKYFASEFSKEDTNFIENFFLKFKINGEAFSCNIVKEYELLSKYPCDVCFAFKLFDVLESQEEHISYKIISSLKCNYLVASFSMKNIKNLAMKRTSVSYFERFLINMGFSWSTISIENELFYIVDMKEKE